MISSPLFAVDAQKLLDQGKVQEAIDLCIQGLEVFPNYQAAVGILAQAYKQIGNEEKANDTLKKAMDKFPTSKSLNNLKKFDLQLPKSLEMGEGTAMDSNDILSDLSKYDSESVDKEFDKSINAENNSQLDLILDSDLESSADGLKVDLSSELEDEEIGDYNFGLNDETAESNVDYEDGISDMEINDLEQEILNDENNDVNYDLASNENINENIEIENEINNSEEEKNANDIADSILSSIDEELLLGETNGIDSVNRLNDEELSSNNDNILINIEDGESSTNLQEELNEGTEKIETEFSLQSRIEDNLDLVDDSFNTISRGIVENDEILEIDINNKDLFGDWKVNEFLTDFKFEINLDKLPDLDFIEKYKDTILEPPVYNGIDSAANTMDIEKLAVNLEGAKVGPAGSNPDVAKGDYSEQGDPNIATETLAKIYEEQDAFDEAIAVYEILVQKRPEKSEFYNSKIEKLKKHNL